MKKITTRKLVESALLIAVATVLSLVKIDLPFGGGVTIVSMLPLVIASHRYGWKWGVVTAFVYSVLQLILGLDNVGYATSFVMALGVIFLDYIIAYTVIGLSGLFGKDRKGVAIGILVTFCLRFVCHLITGAWIWGEWMPEEFMSLTMTGPWLYSFLYNGWYMLAEIVLTEIVAMLIYKPLGKFFRGEDLAQ
ncbi:MAG: energy-coupled thiamine transporter ThiT [Oscillospiraceae bacterium]